MASNVPISEDAADFTAPTPQNTPLTLAPINFGLSRPTVPDIAEDKEDEEAAAAGPSMDDLKETMLGMVEGKLATLLGKSSGYIESLPVEIKLNVEALKGLQVQQNDLHRQYKKECFELEKKYLERQNPIYERRDAIINGKAPATSEEIEAGEQASLKDDIDYTPLPKDSSPSTSGIPHFWLTALRNHPGLNDLITDRDSEALKHLRDVRLAYLKEGEEIEIEDEKAGEADKGVDTKGKFGFRLFFHFEPNPFFENDVLIKTYLYQEEVGYTGDFVYDRALGTKVKWKEEKDLTMEYEIKKQRNKNTNRTRLVRKAHPIDSFFNFFSPPDPPSEDAIETGELEERELDALEEKIEIDYQIGEDLKEKIIPRAIDYFTGKALEYEVVDEDDEEEFTDDDDDGDDGNSETDSDDGSPIARRRGAGGATKARGGGASGEGTNNNEDCKQQ